MSATDRFIDTNVLLYLLSADPFKADRAEQTLARGGTINVQVLNEFASVCLRKLRMPVSEVMESLTTIREVCVVQPLTLEVHQLGLQFVARYRLSIYDAMIVAAGMHAGCSTLASEDFQHGQVFEGVLRVQNPFSEFRTT
jgi:predicted nucleic acid-binding protein